MYDFNTEAWLNLGIPGAVLFILLICIVLVFNQQNKSIGKLCEKIDTIVTSFADNSSKLNEVIISNDKDQKELLRRLSEIHDEVKDMQSRVVRIDARIFDHIKKYDNKGANSNDK